MRGRISGINLLPSSGSCVRLSTHCGRPEKPPGLGHACTPVLTVAVPVCVSRAGTGSSPVRATREGASLRGARVVLVQGREGGREGGADADDVHGGEGRDSRRSHRRARDQARKQGLCDEPWMAERGSAGKCKSRRVMVRRRRKARHTQHHPAQGHACARSCLGAE